MSVEHKTSTRTDHGLYCGEFELRWTSDGDALRGPISLLIGGDPRSEVILGTEEVRDLRDITTAYLEASE